MASLVPSERDLGSLPPVILTYFLVSKTVNMSGTDAKVPGSVSPALRVSEAPLGWIGFEAKTFGALDSLTPTGLT